MTRHKRTLATNYLYNADDDGNEDGYMYLQMSAEDETEETFEI
jgi:hypothetical protein